MCGLTLKFEQRVMERTLGVKAHLIRTRNLRLRGSFWSNTASMGGRVCIIQRARLITMKLLSNCL